MIFYKVDADGRKVLADGNGIIDDVVVLTANYTLRIEDSGKTFMVATDALTITLPSTALGLEYTFMNSGADGNNDINVSPAAADGISGTITLAASVVELSGAVDKDLINTKATATTGNTTTIVGSGTAGDTAWMVKSSTGIWGSEL